MKGMWTITWHSGDAPESIPVYEVEGERFGEPLTRMEEKALVVVYEDGRVVRYPLTDAIKSITWTPGELLSE